MDSLDVPFSLLPTYAIFLFSGVMISVSLLAHGLNEEGARRHIIGPASNELFVLNSFALIALFIRLITEFSVFKTIGIFFIGLIVFIFGIGSFHIIHRGINEYYDYRFLEGANP